MSQERSIPSGVRLLAWTRTIRYVGWGFGESLIPILIMGLSGTFVAAGMIRSSYEITLLVALPVLGLLAERYPAKWLVVAGLCIYPFVGFGYFLAGVTGLLIFVVVARAINGITWGLDSTGIDTYFRRLTPGGSLASSFGFLDTLSQLGWIAAALAGIWLIRYFSIGELLLLVAPTSLLALPLAFAARRDHPALGRKERRLPLREAYASTFEEWAVWDFDLRLLALLMFFMSFVSVLIGFFIPIDIYQSSHDLVLVIVFGAVTAIPSVFGYLLGWLADRHDNKLMAALACVGIALILIALSLPIPYMLTVLGGLLLGVLMELVSIIQRNLATKHSTADRYGRLDSVFGVIGGIGDLAAPPVVGAALDMAGFSWVAALLGGIAVAFAMVFIVNARRIPYRTNLIIPTPQHEV
jgi:MFS family permease